MKRQRFGGEPKALIVKSRRDDKASPNNPTYHDEMESEVVVTSKCENGVRCPDSKHLKAIASSEARQDRKTNHDHKHSCALQNIVGPNEGTELFFKETWQLHPKLYEETSRDGNMQNSNAMEGSLGSVLSMGWDEVASFLQKSRILYNNEIYDEIINVPPPPLIFRNQVALQPDEIQDLYGSNPFAAYLDGCSIVVNHADKIFPPFAELCEDLQRSFPHCYINTYLTPPGSSAVAAHADDRDVIVIQILGRKEWSVFGDVPIKFPYTHEQVGKGNCSVPKWVTEKTPIINKTILPGDALYMPRGYVHCACTHEGFPSLHATVAIATHDWSFSKLMSNLIKRHLDEIPDFRKAIPFDHMIMKDKISYDLLQKDIDNALQLMKKKLTVRTLIQNMENTTKLHNINADSMRQSLSKAKAKIKNSNFIVGAEAAVSIGMNSMVRASTPAERASVNIPTSLQADGSRGLNLREETTNDLLKILQPLKNDLSLSISVSQFSSLIQIDDTNSALDGGQICEINTSFVCDFTLLCFAKCCVELGVMAKCI